MSLTWTSGPPPAGDNDHVNHYRAPCGPLRLMIYTEENNENVWFYDLDCDSTVSTTDAVIVKKFKMDFKGAQWPDHNAAKAKARDYVAVKLDAWKAAL